MSCEHRDIIIVGAGLTGIGAACHLSNKCPDRSYLLLESRQSSGGTWDLFRYPGIRSDSDMHTLGYSFKPWQSAKAIADGPSILRYVRETAAENAIDQHIHYHVVPRWSGDTNFMPVISDTKVMIEKLNKTWERLKPEFS